jgi:8-oxo-dGTP diphosphatase
MGTMDVIEVTAAVIRRADTILLARRPEGSHFAGMWEFPGGKIDPGETPEECLARELLEEFGLLADIGAFVTSTRFRHENGEIELLAYEARFAAGAPQLNSHDEIAWVPVHELLDKDLAPADVAIAEVVMGRAARSE